MRLQVVGEAARADGMVLDGMLHEDDFHLLLTRDGAPTAGAAANRPRELPRLRAAVAVAA